MLNIRLVATLEKATSRHTRQRNLQATLQAVVEHGSTSRADIARLTGLTRASVSSLVMELIGQGLLIETGQGESAGGKPPTLLAFNGGSRQIVALDLGGRRWEGARYDLNLQRLGRRHTRAAVKGPAGASAVVEMAERLVGEADAPVLGVGVGSPGLVSADGTVRQASNLEWEELALRERLETTLGLPGVVANDASAAALADMERGETNASILVVLGEGVGAGLVMGGELFGGEHSAAGELGHVVVEPNGAICSCGNRGCLETVASVPAILRALNAPTDLDPGPDLEDLRRRFGPDRVDVVLSSVGMRVADVLAPIVAMLDLARVRIAVEIQGAAEVVAASAEVVLRSRLLPAVSRVLRVEATGKVDDLVLAGAAGLVARRRLGVVP